MQKDVTMTWGTLRYGQATLTESALQLTSTSTKFENGVTIRAASGNTGYVYIGDSSVTTSNGYQLAAGQSVTIAVNDLNKIYGVGSVNPQTVSWIGV